MQESALAIGRTLIPGVARGQVDAMMSLADLFTVVESEVAVSVMAELRRQVRVHAWHSFASALRSNDRRQVPSMISRAIDGELDLRMIALLERAQNPGRDGQTAVSVSPALRSALDRYASFRAIEARRNAIGRKPASRSVGRQVIAHHIVRSGCKYFKKVFAWLKHWRTRIRNRGR